jgi:hypothetical protein
MTVSWWVVIGAEELMRRLFVQEEGFYALQVLFGVDSYGVEVGGLDVDGDVVFEEAELFEAFGLFEEAWGQGGEAFQGGLAVGVEADMLPVLWGGSGVGLVVMGPSGLSVAVVGDCGAGEVEGAAVRGGDYFYGVGVGDVFWRAEDFERGDFDVMLGEGSEEGGEVLRLEEGLVALDVDVDVGVVLARDGVDTVGAAGEIGRGELDGPVVAVAEFGDLFGVGGDEDPVELGAGAGGLVDPGEHGASGDSTEDFTGEACGGEAGGDDAEDGRLLALAGLLAMVAGRLFAVAGIKYDWRWLCRGDGSL